MKLYAIGALVLALLTIVSAAECGVEVEYIQPSGAGSTKQDCLETNVCLTRYEPGPIYNAGQLTVEWACGKCSDATEFYSSDDYSDRELWKQMKDDCFDGSNGNIPGSDTCLHVVSSANYYDFAWTSWDIGKAGGEGGFAYKRTLYCATGDEPVVCPTDLKICPDGSNVGRSPPDCEFAPCPGGEPPVEPPRPIPKPGQPADNTLLYIVGLLVVAAAIAVLYLKKK